MENEHGAIASEVLTVATASTATPDTLHAVQEIVAAVMAGRGRGPDFISVHHGASRPVADLWPLLMAAFSTSAVHGATSCQGVMTERGFLDDNDDAIGVFALWDRSGAFGSAMEPLGACARTAARNATQSALRRAGRQGEVPEIVWMSVSPGQEEDVLDGIREVVGDKALIVGGSAADSMLTGAWSVFSTDGISGTGVVVSVLFPSTPSASVYASGYAPTDRRGIVTAARGRSLLEIDGRPAADVYCEWRNDDGIDPSADRLRFRLQAALAPLGRKHAGIEGVETYLLTLPAGIGPEGSLELLTEVRVGEEVRLMAGSIENLVRRAPRIARQSRDALGPRAVAGALVICCAAHMRAVQDGMQNIVAELNATLRGAPFLGVFTYGEQGEMPNYGIRHANLMISCTAFAAPADGASGSG